MRRGRAAALLAGGILAVGAAVPATARTSSDVLSARTETTTIGKAPETSAEHLAMAESYRSKAAGYRAEAATHSQNLEKYTQQVAVPTDKKVATENPWIKKMRVHCQSYIDSAETLATEADAFAQFHTMRAHETQGR